MTKLFTDRALRKRHRVGDGKGPVNLLTPPLRLTLALGVLIAASGGLWATLARVPISVNGKGVLLPVSTINSSSSNTSGTVHWYFDQPAQAWHNTARLFRNDPERFSNQQVAALAQTLVRETAALYDNKAKNRATKETSTEFLESRKRTFRGQKLSDGALLLWVQSSAQQERLQSALTELNRTLADSLAQSNNIQSKLSIFYGELTSQVSFLEKMTALETRGFVSRIQILETQTKVDGIRSQILNNRSELITIQSNSDKAYQQLRKELATMINQELIFATGDVYISQVIPNNGESVPQGQELLRLSANDINDPVHVPLFLSSREMAQVSPGMKALATPSGYRLNEVGGIQSHVVSMDKLPSSKESVLSRVGSRPLADVIMQREPSPTLAVLALKRAPTSTGLNNGGYLWSSGGDLPFPPKPGDQLEVLVTTRNVAPIELVLPALRSFFGWSPPQTPASRPQRQP